ncbi:hypothetical protein [Pedobacter panaciterrae]
MTIKRSTQPYRSLVWLFVTLIPVVLFSYAMFEAHGNNDRIVFGIIAMVFLLPAIVDFIANKLIRLKAAIMISEQGLMLSSSKGLYDSFAFLQIFQFQRKKLIQWQNITGFRLLVHYKYLTSYPNEGEGTASTTYSVAQYQLCAESETRNEDVIFSVHNLDRTPDEILMHCNEFLKKYRDKI